MQTSSIAAPPTRPVAATLVRGCAALLLAAAANAAGSDSSGFDGPAYCLQADGVAGREGEVPLRLAGAPLGAVLDVGMAASIYSGTRGGRVPEMGGHPFAALMGGTVPAVMKALYDGNADALAGRLAQAGAHMNTCIRLAQSEKDVRFEAHCVNNLAVIEAAQGRLMDAKSGFLRALDLYQRPHTARADGSAARARAEQQAKALLDRMAPFLSPLQAQQPPAQRAQAESARSTIGQQMANEWAVINRVDLQRAIERTTLNLGNLALAVGQTQEAEGLLRQALQSHPRTEPSACASAAATDLARVYRSMGRADDEKAVLARFRTSRPPAGSSDEEGVMEGGILRLSVGGAREAPARTAVRSGEPQVGTATLARFGEPAGRFDDGALARLAADAASTAPADPTRSAGLWRQLALRAMAAQRLDLAYTANAALMRHHASRGESQWAVFHGKLAAIQSQTVRARLQDRSPSRDARRAFLRTRRDLLVGLVHLLLDQKRLAEAESVLQILKEDEGQQFFDRERADSLESVKLNNLEANVLQHQERIARELGQAESARVEPAKGALRDLAGGMLQALSKQQLEAMRLRLGLGLPELPALIRAEPLNAPSRGLRALTEDLRGLLLSPSRLEQFLDQLIEDSPRFDPPATRQEIARLGSIARGLPELRAEIRPLLTDEAIANSPSFTVRLQARKTEKQEPLTLGDYLTAESATRIWRSIQKADAIETRYLGQSDSIGATLTGPAVAPESGDTPAVLRRQSPATALLYYLPANGRLDILKVTAAGRRHYRQGTDQRELNGTIEEFLGALGDRYSDPLPSAGAMHRLLFSPVERDLSEEGIRVVALSLSGKLRFVPFGALHDGRGWLIERFGFAIHPGGPLSGRLAKASPNWRVVAFGSTRDLPGVRWEVMGVVRRGAVPGEENGALPGEVRLNEAFTADALRRALSGGAQVIHIASHFDFVEKDVAQSSLLLGDGGRLSLRELAGPQYRFDRTELVTLSACTTGRSDDDAYGQEVDGLAALLMGQGASAVLASLWDVADRSTATLMASLYRVREAEKLSRVSALQRAQVTMIRSAGAIDPPGREPPPRIVRLPSPGESTAQPGPKLLGYAHPFHWAPFVLMGNWL